MKIGQSVIGDETIVHGISVRVNIKKLIDNIYVSPTAPKWFFDLVKSTLKRYRYDFEVIQSQLYNV